MVPAASVIPASPSVPGGRSTEAAQQRQDAVDGIDLVGQLPDQLLDRRRHRPLPDRSGPHPRAVEVAIAWSKGITVLSLGAARRRRLTRFTNGF